MRNPLLDQTLQAVKAVQSASVRHPQGTYTPVLKSGVIYVRLVSTDGEEEAVIIDGDTVTAAASAAFTHPELIDELTRRGFAVQWVDAIIDYLKEMFMGKMTKEERLAFQSHYDTCEDLEDLEKRFDDLKAERNLYHATLTECLKIAGWASSGDGDTAWACEDIEVNIEEAFNKSADKDTQ